jgi:hypothetical protein
MKKIILAILGVAATFATFGQGTITIANLNGSQVVPILLPDGTTAKGANYSVEVFSGDGAVKIGNTLIVKSSGLFNGGAQSITGVAPGSIATLTIRAWDNTTGADYVSATLKGNATFKTSASGGDVDGDPSTPPAVPGAMVNGKADGFQGIQLQGPQIVPEPSTIALGALGVAALLLRRRK